MTNQETDMLIAEKVMGWRPMGGSTSGGFWAPEKHRTQMIDGSQLHLARKKLDIQDDKVGDGFCVSFCTNMTDAWKVVDKIKSMGHRLSGVGEANGKHYAAFMMDPVGGCGIVAGYESYGTADTPAMAICLAALKLVESKAIPSVPKNLLDGYVSQKTPEDWKAVNEEE